MNYCYYYCCRCLLNLTSTYKIEYILILFKLLFNAVVAQPGRALDQYWGEAEDRAVVSSNLTDGIYFFQCHYLDMLYYRFPFMKSHQC